VRVAIYPTHALYLVSRLVADFYESLLRVGSPDEFADRFMGFEEFNSLLGLEAIRALEEEFTEEFVSDSDI
jgi:hypothetical protein